jgi:chaperonin GroES
LGTVSASSLCSTAGRYAGFYNVFQGFCPGLQAAGSYQTVTVGVDTHLKVRPLHDRIIVQRIDEGEQKIGGIIIPDTAKEKPQQGKVIAVGLGKREKGERVPLDVKEGETILFGKYSGQDIKIDGEEYLIMREDEVLAVLDSK